MPRSSSSSIPKGSVTVTVPNKAQTMKELTEQGIAPHDINTFSWFTSFLIVCAIVMYMKVIKK